MNTTTLKMLEEFDDLAVRGIDAEIAEFQDLMHEEKRAGVRAKMERRIKNLQKLRKQLLWGV